MLNNRHFISYFSTILMYALGISLFFYAQSRYLVSIKKSEEKTLQLCMSFQPEVISTVEQVEQEEIEEVKEVEKPVVEEEPVVEEKPVSEEEPIVEPETIEEPIEEKKPDIKEDVIPEPIVPKVTPKPVKKEVKKKPKKKIVQKKTAKKKQVRQKASARKIQISPAQKNQFLANIREKINKNKSYPRVAKKRGMQGTVDVRFTILSNGQVGNILVDGPKIFHTSAQNAVKAAFPINIKNAPISLPMSINIKLRYQIR